MRRLLSILATGASLTGISLAGLVACAPTSPSQVGSADVTRPDTPWPERQCFRASQVNNFRADAQHVYLKVGQSAIYELTTAGACQDLNNAFRVAVLPAGGASSLCTGDPATLVTPGQARPTEICRVRIERRLSESEIAALPARLRP